MREIMLSYLIRIFSDFRARHSISNKFEFGPGRNIELVNFLPVSDDHISHIHEHIMGKMLSGDISVLFSIETLSNMLITRWLNAGLDWNFMHKFQSSSKLDHIVQFALWSFALKC